MLILRITWNVKFSVDSWYPKSVSVPNFELYNLRFKPFPIVLENGIKFIPLSAEEKIHVQSNNKIQEKVVKNPQS